MWGGMGRGGLVLNELRHVGLDHNYTSLSSNGPCALVQINETGMDLFLMGFERGNDPDLKKEADHDCDDDDDDLDHWVNQSLKLCWFMVTIVVDLFNNINPVIILLNM